MIDYDGVWVFNGLRAKFPSAVFTDRHSAEAWIRQHGLSGTLTKYPLNSGVYDWAVQNGLFAPKKAEHSAAEFVASFTTASMEHYHYETEST
jgi:hypothetical protein